MHLSLVINVNHSKENVVERNRSNPVFQDLYVTAITQNPTSYLGAQLLDSSSRYTHTNLIIQFFIPQYV